MKCLRNALVATGAGEALIYNTIRRMELVVFGLMAGIGFASWAWWARSRAAAAAPPRLAAPERTLATLEPGDIVEHLGTDWLVEGTLALADERRSTRLYRLTDGAVERFLFTTPAEADPALLERIDLEIGAAPERLEHQGARFSRSSRASGAVTRAGSFSRKGSGERAIVVAYAAGEKRLVLLEWIDRTEAFLGERVPAHLLELLPGK